MTFCPHVAQGPIRLPAGTVVAGLSACLAGEQLSGRGVDFEVVASRSESEGDSPLAELAVQRCVRPWRDVVIITITLLALSAAPALGASVTQAPTIAGDPTPGFELTASPGVWTPAGAAARYDWLRCSASGDGCTPVAGSCDRRYTVRDADLGHTLRVRLTVTERGQPPASGISDATAVVVNKPYSIPTEGDSGQPCVDVTSTGPLQGTFTSGGQTGPGTTPAPDTSLAFIDPFPVVRISGRFTRRRTKLRRVTVRAPVGARIRIDCKGRGCPYRRRAIAVKFVRVRALHRSYRPGAAIEIRVTQRRKIGKYTRVRTRRGKAPLRIDRCLMPGSTRPVRCPTA
jgi:hypothetical protein